MNFETENGLAILHKQNAAEFVRLAKTMMLTGGRVVDALDPSHRLTPRLQGIIKAGVAVAATNDANNGAELADYNNLSASFLESLQGWGAYDRLLADGFRKAPMRTRINFFTSGATGYTVEELKPSNITSMALDSSQLTQRQTIAQAVVSRELAQHGSNQAMTLLGDELRKAVALATDTAFVTSLLDNDDIPTNASGGLSASTVTADLQNAVSALQAGSNARIVVLCPPYALRCIAMLRGTGGPVFPGVGVNGGSSSGVEFIGTDSLDSDLIVLDASQAFAASDGLHLDTSTQADIEMSDDATDGTVSRHSLFQNNWVAIRCVRLWAFELLRPQAAFIVTGVSEVTA
jgi:Phage capsid family